MAKYKKPTYIIIQEAMAERIRFLEKANTRKWRARCS
nr:MAG TPA: hypothetical protein [Caudoviricetes sp.]